MQTIHPLQYAAAQRARDRDGPLASAQWSHSPGVPQPTPQVPPVPPEISPDIDEPEFPDTPTPPVQDPPPQPQPIIGRH